MGKTKPPKKVCEGEDYACVYIYAFTKGEDCMKRKIREKIEELEEEKKKYLKTHVIETNIHILKELLEE